MLYWLGLHKRAIQLGALAYATVAGVVLLVLGALLGDWISIAMGLIIVVLGVGNLLEVRHRRD